MISRRLIVAVALWAAYVGLSPPPSSLCAQEFDYLTEPAQLNPTQLPTVIEATEPPLIQHPGVKVEPGLRFGVPTSDGRQLQLGGHSPTPTTGQPTQATDSQAGVVTPDRIIINAKFVQQWSEGQTVVRLLRGVVQVSQAGRTWETREAVCWESPVLDGHVAQIYLDGDSEYRSGDEVLLGRDRFISLKSRLPILLRGSAPVQTAATHDPVVIRAAERRAIGRPPDQVVEPVQFTDNAPAAEPFPPTLSAPQLPTPRQFDAPPLVLPPALEPGTYSNGQLFPASFSDRVTITPRNFEMPLLVDLRPVPGTTPPEQVMTVTRGVNVVIERPLEGDVLDLTADSAVIWTPAIGSGGGTDFNLGPDTPFQIYLQGNIILRQGETVARASEAYFDRREGRGMLRGAEVRTFVPSLRGDLRVKAEDVRFQLLSDQLQNVGGSDIEVFANNAWVTASRFGKPSYRLQSGSLSIRQRQIGQTFDPVSGQIKSVTEPWLTSERNQFVLGDFPIVATPYISAPARDFNVPLKRVSVASDRIFGVQLLTRWDVGDLFGLTLPPDTEWTVDADYLSERGPRLGTDWDYRFDHDVYGLRAQSFGEGFASFIYDDGFDNVGLGRRKLLPEDEARGALIGRHRTTLPFGYTLNAEAGYISDYNFLEQYEEQQWDNEKDAETLLELRRQLDNSSWSLLVRPQVNDFVNQTEWLPRFDTTTLSQPLFVLDAINSSVNWSQHSMAGYASLNPSIAPPNLGAPDQFGVAYDPLPYMADVGGLVAMTRHQLTLPFDVGAVRVVPYAMGEVAFWEEGLDGNDLGRAYGVAGIRGSMMMTKLMPYIRSDVWGLNGLAHKMIFDFDYSYADSSRNLGEIPQYNEFDDNAQERFRERFVDLAFGGALPATADPRGYALRTGAGRAVTSPYHELVDDINVLTLGWRHRLQTRSGPPQARRVRDWMTLNLETSFFPGAEDFTADENFGETVGLLSARYAWHVGERTSLLADALYDLFDLSQETWSIGVLTQRFGRGSVYLGYRSIGLGPLDSDLLTLNMSYAMSEKWLGYYAFTHDFAENRGQGHALGLTRVGADFIGRFQVDVDESKDDFGLSLMVEPFIGSRDAKDIDTLLQDGSKFNARASRFR